jgi:hypothetical protein
LLDNNIGLLLTHVSQRNLPNNDGWIWAADNACFTGKTWDSSAWLRWLEKMPNPQDALFATVPDFVADHKKTLEMWPQWFRQVKDLGFKPAFILQNGCTPDEVPWDECDAVFIGGSTEWKLGIQAEAIVREARKQNKWIHMGRVNSLRRMTIAVHFGCDSVDGTYLAFAPDLNALKLVNMMKRIEVEPSLFDYEEAQR